MSFKCGLIGLKCFQIDTLKVELEKKSIFYLLFLRRFRIGLNKKCIGKHNKLKNHKTGKINLYLFSYANSWHVHNSWEEQLEYEKLGCSPYKYPMEYATAQLRTA